MAFKDSNFTLVDDIVSNRLECVDSFLKKIETLIDFNQLRPILKKNGIGTKNVCGAPAYDSVRNFSFTKFQNALIKGF